MILKKKNIRKKNKVEKIINQAVLKKEIISIQKQKDWILKIKNYQFIIF